MSHTCVSILEDLLDQSFQHWKIALFSKVGSNYLLRLCLTATWSKVIVRESEKLFGLKVNHTHWPSTTEIKNRKLSLWTVCTSQLMRHIKKEISSILVEEIGNETWDDQFPIKIIIHEKTRSKIEDIAQWLEDLLDSEDKLRDHNVLALHRRLSKEEKLLIIISFFRKGCNDEKNKDSSSDKLGNKCGCR